MPNTPLSLRAFLTSLAAPAETTHDELKVSCKKSIIFTYNVASINTNVTVGLRISNDGTNFAVAPGVVDVVHTADGEYALLYNGPARFISLVLIAETGGTAVIVTPRSSYGD